jgi:hypothetical protein
MTQPVFDVPSGQAVTLQDMFWEEGEELTLRVRFIAPQIARAGGVISHDVAALDMRHLCETVILPQIEAGEDKPAFVVLTFSDVAVPFGEAAPEATQFFEAYQIENGACISELF